MISERQLAHHPSFWAAVAPMLEPFVRVINRNVIRCFPVVPSLSPVTSRALINECGFQLARRQLSGAVDLDVAIPQIAGDVHDHLSLFDGVPGNKLESIVTATSAVVEISALAKNIGELASKIGGKTSFAPRFPGCGYVSSCIGDLIVGDCLTEVKAGKRSFRSEDLRQALVYAMLNFASSSPYHIERLALANPREGILSIMPLTVLIRRVASSNPEEFFARFMFLVSGGGTSR